MKITHKDLCKLLQHPNKLYKKLKRMKHQIPNEPSDIKFQHIHDYKILYTIWTLSLIKPHTKYLMKHDYQQTFKHKPRHNNTYNYNKEHSWRYRHYLNDYQIAKQKYEHVKVMAQKFNQQQHNNVPKSSNTPNNYNNKNDPLDINHFLDTVYKISKKSDE